MNLVLLPGLKSKHREWIFAVEAAMKPLFEKTYVHTYRHWETGEEMIDFEYEKQKLVEATKNFGEYIVFAKSVGTLVTLSLVREGKISPKACLFTGVPILWARANNIPAETLLDGYKTKTIFIQNEFDPCLPAEELWKILSEKGVINNTNMTLAGDTHSYDDFEVLQKSIQNLI